MSVTKMADYNSSINKSLNKHIVLINKTFLF